MDVCSERNARCSRFFELLPSAPIRARSLLRGFNTAFVGGDLTLAENQALLLKNHPALAGNYTEYLLCLVHAAQGQYQQVRERLEQYRYGERYSEMDEAVLWLTLLLDYGTGDWVAFSERVNQYAQLTLFNGCACLYQARLVFLQGIVQLHDNHLLGAVESFRQTAHWRTFFPLLAVWGQLGEIEVQLRLKNTLIAQNTLHALIAQLGADHPLVGWQLFFPDVLQVTQQQQTLWRQQDFSVPVHTGLQVLPETAAYRLYVFGSGRLFYGSREIPQLTSSPDAKQLLAYLAFRPEGATGHEILTDLWPDRAEEEAAFTALLESIAHWAPEPLIRYEQGVYAFRPDIWVDAIAYAERYAGIQLAHEIPPLLEVKQLYTASFLHGVAGLWVEERRLRYQSMQSWLLWRLAQLYLTQNDYAMAQRLLEASIDSNYTFDRGMNDLMRLLEQQGLRGDALRRYDLYCKRIQQIYHVPPAPHLQQLAERLRQESTQVTGAFRSSDIAAALRPTRPTLPMAQEGRSH